MFPSELLVLRLNAKMGKKNRQYNRRPCKIYRGHERDLLLEKQKEINSNQGPEYSNRGVRLEEEEGVFCLDPPLSDLSISSPSLSLSRSDSWGVESVGMMIR